MRLTGRLKTIGYFRLGAGKVVLTVSGKLLTIAIVGRNYNTHMIVAVQDPGGTYQLSERHSYRMYSSGAAVQCGDMDLPLLIASCGALGLKCNCRHSPPQRFAIELDEQEAQC